MNAALFSIVPYEGPVAQKGWPVPTADYDPGTAQASMRRALDFFELADEVGFDWVSVAEHHYAPGSLTPNPMVMAGAPPSGSSSNPYVTYRVNPAESRERFIEALALIVRPWTEPQPFGWLGRYHEYRTISIWPRPVQEPHPPIFMSISSPEMAEFAATHRISAGLRPGRPARATPAVPGRASRPPDTVPAVRRTTSPTG